MAQPSPEADRFRKAFLLTLALAISLIFWQMIKGFVVALLMAAIVAGMSHPLYRWQVPRLGYRKPVAAILTILLVFLVVVVPLTGLLGIIAAQAVQVSQNATPAIERLINEPDQLEVVLRRLPFYESLLPYHNQILEKIGELTGRIGSFIVDALAATTRGTAVFFINLFIMLYAMYFFLTGGRRILNRILYYAPLVPQDENLLVGKFVSVARATLKGTLVIGVVQGGLAGGAFWVAGVSGAVFWGAVMTVLSIIPGVGTALVWVPTVIYLVISGSVGTGIALAVWCILVVGMADNVLRPWLVGRDTKMSDLLVLLGTLGGLVLFGALGIVIGPVVAALFVTVWDLYGQAFKDFLPEVPIVDDGTSPEIKRS